MAQNIPQKNNNLHNKEECPNCHFIFVSGFSPDGKKKCPSCNHNFISGQKINHGSGCSICQNRNKDKNISNGSNNVYYSDGCPALMSDGRFMTYHNSSNELTDAMRKLNGFKNSNEFRKFMQNNGNLFMNSEINHIKKQNTCSPNMACSEGWYKLWTKNNGKWQN
ncbi:MAG: hypothetical protein Satyrvirus10_6 [Satyrvirus sp.]|uniref:Uncharacterized protein n=1 Tax=Satyrvirus sp. TaxID=2487771 RepID=A0A3G5ADK7_9VIRU|nr:MAG: hypothetical protein Satyrvirus10_6 [Satyrvirus sp.]